MKPARFRLSSAPRRSTRRSTLLHEDGDDARVIAGGQSLMPMLSMRLARPQCWSTSCDLPELREDRGRAATPSASAPACARRQLLAWPDLAERQPLLAAALPWVGHAQTRSRGTVCGSVAHADPSAEIPLALLALDGSVELSSQRKRRRVKADEFFTGMMSTARAEDEMIEAVSSLPARPGTAMPSASSAAATAISPSSPARPWSRPDGRTTRHRRRRRPPDRARFRGTRRQRARRRARTPSPGSSTPATTCMPPRAIAANWCAGSAAPPIEEARRCRA